jgi:hypothetical protein
MDSFEDIVKRNRKSFEKISSLVVDRYTYIDDYNLINVCELDGCHRTSLYVTKSYLKNELRNNYKLVGTKSALLHNTLLNILEGIFDLDSDTSLIILYHFIFPEIYKKYYEPLEPDYINESIRNRIDYEKKQKKYLEFVYNDLIENTKWRDASFSDIDLYDGKCKGLQTGINWGSSPPSFNYIPVCLSNTLYHIWGLNYEEIKDLFWGKYDKYLINMKLKRHQPYNLIESIDRTNKFKLTKSQINSLLSNYEYMGYDEEYAKEDLIDLVSYLNKLPSTLKLYRIICADDINEIDRISVGSHYSPNKNNLLRDHYEGGSIHSHCFGVKVFLLTVEVDKTKMDVLQTLSNNILYPHEEEITLKNKGKGAQIINIEEL